MIVHCPWLYADTNAAGVELVYTEQGTDTIDSMALQSHEGDLRLDATLDGPPTETLSQNRDLWQRIRDGFGMVDLQSPFTAIHESWYAARPDYVKRMVDRSQRYLHYIVEEVQRRGMPTEIALLPMVESAFNPHAYSRSKASGIWQFVPSTGKHFGLQQNWWADNRRDIIAATNAALNYLEKLHVMFGTWELALAAYNAGEGTVQRAIERNRRKGLPTDYQSLPLPEETRNYVPKLQAVKNIVSNPQQYGLEIPSIPDQPYFTKVQVPAKIDINVAAKLAEISIEEFTALNPAPNRPLLMGAGGGVEILLPLEKVDEFEANLASYDRPLVNWQTYYPQRGERLSSISRKFGISVAQLRDINGLSPRARLKPNQPLLVPVRGDAIAQTSPPSTPDRVAMKMPAAEDTHHRVKKGDTLHSIAKRYGIGAKQLMALNGLKSERLRQGQILKVAGAAKAPASRTKSHYIVKRGETLTSIAKKFNVATSDLKRWNNLGSKRTLTPGQALVIFKEEA
ncbi:MAG: LysM peptidoglycan-binding domain-containing protein [Methylophilaceae bacterium]|nr:LysM peptidoglycan-binding domain-containing protein [Methylophilaceae bacterium]